MEGVGWAGVLWGWARCWCKSFRPEVVTTRRFQSFPPCEFLLRNLSEGEWTFARNSVSANIRARTVWWVGRADPCGGGVWDGGPRWGRQKGFVRGLREGGKPGWRRGSGRPPLCQGTPRRGRKWGQTFVGLTSERRGGMGFGLGLQFEKGVGRGVCSSFSIATEFRFPSYILKYAAFKNTRVHY